MRLTEERREILNKKEFVFPKERKYPIDTEKRARAALGFVAMHGSAEEKARVRTAVYRRYPNMGQEKRAEKIDEKKEQAKRLAKGALAGFAAGGAFILAKNPGIRAHLKWSARNAISKAERSPPPTKEVIEQVDKAVDATIATLRKKGVKPESARIAVAGLSGSGKTVFARRLAEKLNVKHVNLDEVAKRPKTSEHLKKGWAISEYMRDNPVKKGSGVVYDHFNVVNKASPRNLDAAIFIDLPNEVLKKRGISRGRGAYMTEYTHTDKIRGNINKAMELLGGETATVPGNASLKVKVRTRKTPFDDKDTAINSAPNSFWLDRDRVIARMNKPGDEKYGPINRYIKKKRMYGDIATPFAGAGTGAGIAYVSGRKDEGRK